MTLSKLVELNNGTTIPRVGFGAGTSHYGAECGEQLLSALEIGYRYLDCAEQYGNSTSIRTALGKWTEAGHSRDEVYILTKYGTDGVESDPEEVLDRLLVEMGVDYVDLYLIHSPFYALAKGRTLSETWKLMEALVASGKTKSVGVSNFREEDLVEMADSWSIPPAVNQIEYNPYVAHQTNVKRLLALCKEYNIKLQSYGAQTPISRSPGGPVDAVVKRIAVEKGCTPGQVLLLWAAQLTEGIVVTTSRQADRQKEQLEALSAIEPLTVAELEEVSQSGEGRYVRYFNDDVWQAAKP